MKKSGFTLAELLITLGIIGVVSALLISATNMLSPDQNKVLCLKAYDTINTTIKNLASDSKIYPTCKNPADDDTNVNCKDFPLFNTDKPLSSDLNNDIYSGDKKLCSLLAYSMGVKESNISCSNTTYTYNDASFNNDFNTNLSFTTQNGMQWRITPQVASSAISGTGTYQTDIYVDVNGSKAPNCIYNSETCQKPDRFKFMVAATGQVYPADPYSEQYISTRKSFTKKQYEIADGSSILATLPKDRTFAYRKCHEPLTEEQKCQAAGKYWYEGSCHDEKKEETPPVVCTKKTVPELFNIVNSAKLSYSLNGACYNKESVFYNGEASTFVENYTIGQLYSDNSVLYLRAYKDAGGSKLSKHYENTKSNFEVVLSSMMFNFGAQGLDLKVLKNAYNQTLNETFANVDSGRFKANKAQKGSNCDSLKYTAGKVRGWNSDGIQTAWDTNASDSFYSVVRAKWLIEKYLSIYSEIEYQNCVNSTH